MPWPVQPILPERSCNGFRYDGIDGLIECLWPAKAFGSRNAKEGQVKFKVSLIGVASKDSSNCEHVRLFRSERPVALLVPDLSPIRSESKGISPEKEGDQTPPN